MNSLEVRFNYDPGTAQYNYTQATVEITNISSISRDKETINLTKNGTTFNGAFKISLIKNNETATQGDKILNYYQTDAIVARFQNNENVKLPLDTLKIQIPCNFSSYLFTLNKGIYFDNDANGHVDSIFLGVSYENTDSLAQNLVKALEPRLPQHRKLKALDFKAVKYGIGMRVEEQAPDIRTFVDIKDKLQIADTIRITDKMLLDACEIMFIDSMAPVIMKGDYYDIITLEAGDTTERVGRLEVELSENLNPIGDPRPFRTIIRAPMPNSPPN